MATPLLILFACSIVIGLVTTLIVVVTVSVDNWAYVTYDGNKLMAINDSCRAQGAVPCHLVQISEAPPMYRFDTYMNSYLKNTSSFIYSTESGLWSTCDSLTDDLRVIYLKNMASNFKGKKCFTFVTDYNEDSDVLTLSSGAKQIARLQNSAASCYIVVLIDLSSAAVVGLIGLVQKQVASCMVTGVLYLMAALFGVFGLSMFHTKEYYEKNFCYALDEIPSKLCDARVVSIGYAVPLAWLGVVTCSLSCFVWLCVSRALRVIRAKTML
ncbi:unnamed protein product [Lymnaea stagnalis]|uniref:Claudin n=1 Tax=Lymnaea stagnalis TaxID=6523 RepID=A0AAV2HDI5_LYMST